MGSLIQISINKAIKQSFVSCILAAVVGRTSIIGQSLRDIPTLELLDVLQYIIAADVTNDLQVIKHYGNIKRFVEGNLLHTKSIISSWTEADIPTPSPELYERPNDNGLRKRLKNPKITNPKITNLIDEIHRKLIRERKTYSHTSLVTCSDRYGLGAFFSVNCRRQPYILILSNGCQVLLHPFVAGCRDYHFRIHLTEYGLQSVTKIFAKIKK